MKTRRLLTSPLGIGLLVFGLALIVRLVFVCRFHPPGDFVFSDMSVYEERATNLLSGASSAWDTFTPVGYPALLAAIYALGGSASIVGVLQALLGAVTAGLVATLALRIFQRPLLAWTIGLAAALHLPGVLYAGYLLTETVFAFLVVAACWLLARVVEVPSRRALIVSAAALGLVLGAAATVRPNLLLFLPALPLLLWLGSGRRWRHALLACAVVLGGFSLPVGFAALRNSRLLGRPASLGTNGGLNFYLNLADVRGVRYRERGATHRITPISNLVRFPRDEDEEAVGVPFYDDSHYYQRGLALLRDQPSRLVERGARNLVEAAGIGRQGYWPEHDTRLTRTHRRAFFIAALLPSLAGALLLIGRRRWAARDHLVLVAAAALVASNVVTVFLFLGDPRMRVPFDPLVMLLAAAGYVWLAELLEKRWTALLRLRRSRPTLDHKL
jgi:4-amino-4-deoxy-L-arabinose transferase-like glycosyltransferase